MRRRAPNLLKRLRQYPVDDIAISSITLAELQYGVAKSARPEHNTVLLAEFCAPIEVLPFDIPAADVYGGVRAALERAGTPIGPLDILIASHAMSVGMAVVTNNLREFRRVAGLQVESWSA
jgi:tRNA(fMet)-specific endonuclease VapC